MLKVSDWRAGTQAASLHAHKQINHTYSKDTNQPHIFFVQIESEGVYTIKYDDNMVSHNTGMFSRHDSKYRNSKT